MADAATYHAIWRWHFYAGLFVLPFILILSVSGAIYLFKPQIDRWEERDFRGLSLDNPVSASAFVARAQAVSLVQFSFGKEPFPLPSWFRHHSPDTLERLACRVG